MASYEDEQKICAHMLPDACNRTLEKYWWGEKFDEVDAQAKELEEAIRYAVLSNDYSGIEKYISFPFVFWVEDGRGENVSSRRDFNHYMWVAYNMQEFGYWFRKFKEPGDFLIQDFINDRQYTINHSRIGHLELRSVYHSIHAEVICSGFVPTKKNSFYVLPQNLNLCQNTYIQIRNIYFRIYH